MKKNKLIKVDDDLWKELRKKCIDDGISLRKMMENLIKKELGR